MRTEKTQLQEIEIMSERLFKLLLNDSFVRYLRGIASAEEKRRWTAWEQEDADHKQLLKLARDLMSHGWQKVPKPNSESELKRLLARINSERQYQPLDAMRKRNKHLVWVTLAAAATVLLVVGMWARYSFLQQSGKSGLQSTATVYQTMTTDFGERKSIRYSDGSEIVINAHSQLRLPEQTMGRDTMEVWLDGEAYFSIIHKKAAASRTFIVHTADGDISVLGTKFAVSTRESKTRVVLAEGSVRVTPQKKSLKGQGFEMVPGELALFSKQFDSIQRSRVNTAVYTSWMADSLVLDKTPLLELAKRIELTYGVTVEVDQKLENEKLTGRIGNLDLEVLLDGLAKTLDADVRRDGKLIYIKQ